MKGQNIIQAAVILEAWERWRFGYSKLFNPVAGTAPCIILSFGFRGWKRKYTFSLLREARENELPEMEAETEFDL